MCGYAAAGTRPSAFIRTFFLGALWIIILKYSWCDFRLVQYECYFYTAKPYPSYMRRNYFWPLALMIGGLILWACKKEVSREGEPPGTIPSTCGYAPYTNGSTYNYETYRGETADTNFFTVTVTGDSTINGQSYKKLSSDTATTYDRCDNGTYHQMVKGLSYMGYSVDSVMSIYLKDFVPAGSSWSDTVTVKDGGVNVNVYLTYTITQKGINKRVFDLDYTEVIAVRLTAAAKVLGQTIPLGTLATNYYAKDIGLIEVDQEADTTRLRSYNIE